MAHDKRTCVVCGKRYRYCPRCAEFNSLPTWILAYCSEPCQQTDFLTNKYVYKHISADDAAKEIEKLGVEVQNAEIQKIINEIKSEAKPQKKETTETTKEKTTKQL